MANPRAVIEYVAGVKPGDPLPWSWEYIAGVLSWIGVPMPHVGESMDHWGRSAIPACQAWLAEHPRRNDGDD